MQYYGTEITYRVKFEYHFNWFAIQANAIVTPSNPFIACKTKQKGELRNVIENFISVTIEKLQISKYF